MKMGMAAVLMGAAVAGLGGVPAWADYENKLIGNWLTTANEDRFGDGGAFIAATADGTTAMAVRCLQKKLSIGVIDMGADSKPFTEKDIYAFKFRVGKDPIVETVGVAISPRLIELITEKTLVKAIRDGRETAMRVFDRAGTASTFVFKTAGGKKAFADLSKECPLD